MTTALVVLTCVCVFLMVLLWTSHTEHAHDRRLDFLDADEVRDDATEAMRSTILAAHEMLREEHREHMGQILAVLQSGRADLSEAANRHRNELGDLLRAVIARDARQYQALERVEKVQRPVAERLGQVLGDEPDLEASLRRWPVRVPRGDDDLDVDEIIPVGMGG